MRNRAKCKLCDSVLESFHKGDYVECKCGEISISGGNETYDCYAKEWKNFVRVDDLDNEIMVKVEYSEDVKPLYKEESKEDVDLLFILDEMIKNIERLPSEAMSTYINHYDYMNIMMVMKTMYKKLDDKK